MSPAYPSKPDRRKYWNSGQSAERPPCPPHFTRSSLSSSAFPVSSRCQSESAESISEPVCEQEIPRLAAQSNKVCQCADRTCGLGLTCPFPSRTITGSSVLFPALLSAAEMRTPTSHTLGSSGGRTPPDSRIRFLGCSISGKSGSSLHRYSSNCIMHEKVCLYSSLLPTYRIFHQLCWWFFLALGAQKSQRRFFRSPAGHFFVSVKPAVRRQNPREQRHRSDARGCCRLRYTLRYWLHPAVPPADAGQ